MLIGQNKIKELLSNISLSEIKPHTYSIYGRAGCGKTEVVKQLAVTLNVTELLEISSMEELETAIQRGYTCLHKLGIHITSFEQLNFRVKETLLKFCEEPPINVYVFIEVTNIGMYDERFSNRSWVVTLAQYSQDELKSIIQQHDETITEQDILKLFSAFGTPAEFIKAIDCGIDTSVNLVINFVSHLKQAAIYNAMKVFEQISSKTDDGKVDFELFLHGVANLAYRKYLSTADDFYNRLLISANKHLSDIRQIRTINKRAVFDRLIFEAKGEI